MPTDTSHAPESAFHVNGLSVSYGGLPALWDVDIDIPKGAMCAIVGPNGAGKSTLLKAALNLVRPVSGQACSFGQPLKRTRHEIAYAPQRQSVDWDFPTNVRDVVEMGLYRQLGWLRRPGATERARALDALAQVGMEDYANRQISQLSGGQQQRVFIARALVQDAPLLLLDEPTAGVDAATEVMIMDLLTSLQRQGRTVIVVHHDLTTVQTYFDWMVIINVRLIAQGRVADVYNPDNLRAAYGSQLAINYPDTFNGTPHSSGTSHASSD